MKQRIASAQQSQVVEQILDEHVLLAFGAGTQHKHLVLVALARHVLDAKGVACNGPVRTSKKREQREKREERETREGDEKRREKTEKRGEREEEKEEEEEEEEEKTKPPTKTNSPPMSSLEGAWATVGVRATISDSGTEPLSHSRCSPVSAYRRGSHLRAFLS